MFRLMTLNLAWKIWFPLKMIWFFGFWEKTHEPSKANKHEPWKAKKLRALKGLKKTRAFKGFNPMPKSTHVSYLFFKKPIYGRPAIDHQKKYESWPALPRELPISKPEDIQPMLIVATMIARKPSWIGEKNTNRSSCCFKTSVCPRACSPTSMVALFMKPVLSFWTCRVCQCHGVQVEL